MEAVIAAFIAAAASIACQLIIARSGAKENKKSQEATERLIIYRIDRLEQTVSEHNALISRMAAAEQKDNRHGKGEIFMKEKLAKLIDVKSLVTLLMTSVFCILTLKGIVSGEQFITVFTVVISFYFGVQTAKKSGGDGNGKS